MEMCGRREKQRRLRKKRRTGGDREIRRKQMTNGRERERIRGESVEELSE